MNEQTISQILVNVWDLCFRRRVITILSYLNVKDHDLVLDCGCDEGFYGMILSEVYKPSVVGLDVDINTLKMAKKRLGIYPSNFLIRGDATRIPFKDETFDKAILSELLEHVLDDREVLKEVYRVLKPGGTIGITVPNRNYPFLWDPLNKMRESMGLGHFGPADSLISGIWSGHLRLYYPQQIKKLVESVGFKVERIDPITYYCIPFNHIILDIGKAFYTHISIPQLYEAMEKFEWRKTRLNSSLNPVYITRRIMYAIDKLNDRFCGTTKPSVCVALKAVKPTR
ncbi:class I SAM-dependent methyltransferase [Candidatus Bathyarchaeota archaeon]|nr:class I SAM-dependent methyltransferase [Candidatus Bathyarchaeota archaeon]